MTERLVLALVAATGLMGCASSGGDSAALSESTIYNACMPVETSEAMAGGAGRAPRKEDEAKMYANFLCRTVAGTCAANPAKDPCPKDLKRYGLTP